MLSFWYSVGHKVFCTSSSSFTLSLKLSLPLVLKMSFPTMSTISLAHWNESQTHSKSLFLSDVPFVAHFWCIAGNTFKFVFGPQRQYESISMEMLKTWGIAAIPSSCAASFKARRAWNYRTLPTSRFFLPPVQLSFSLGFSLFSILQHTEAVSNCKQLSLMRKKVVKISENPGAKTEKRKW